MKAGDLVEFKCVGAGKTDSPPYTQDGEWRIGVIVGKKKINFEAFNILYRGQVFFALSENCRLIGEK